MTSTRTIFLRSACGVILLVLGGCADGPWAGCFPRSGHQTRFGALVQPRIEDTTEEIPTPPPVEPRHLSDIQSPGGEQDPSPVVGPTGYGYLHQGPTVTGEFLAPTEPVMASERALELRQRVSELAREKSDLTLKFARLQASVETKNELLRQAHEELLASHDDLTSARATLQLWQIELGEVRARIESHEQAQLKTLDEVSEYVNRLILRYSPPQSGANFNTGVVPPPPPASMDSTERSSTPPAPRSHEAKPAADEHQSLPPPARAASNPPYNR